MSASNLSEKTKQSNSIESSIGCPINVSMRQRWLDDFDISDDLLEASVRLWDEVQAHFWDEDFDANLAETDQSLPESERRGKAESMTACNEDYVPYIRGITVYIPAIDEHIYVHREISESMMVEHLNEVHQDVSRMLKTFWEIKNVR